MEKIDSPRRRPVKSPSCSTIAAKRSIERCIGEWVRLVASIQQPKHESLPSLQTARLVAVARGADRRAISKVRSIDDRWRSNPNRLACKLLPLNVAELNHQSANCLRQRDSSGMCVAIRSTDSRQGSASEKHGVGDVSVPSALNGAGVGSGLNRIDSRASQTVVRLETIRPKRNPGRSDFGTVYRSERVAMFQPPISASQASSPCAATGLFSHTPAHHAADKEKGSAERYRNASLFDFPHSPKMSDRPTRTAIPMVQRPISTDHLRDWLWQQSPLDASHVQFGVVGTKKPGHLVGSAYQSRCVPVIGWSAP